MIKYSQYMVAFAPAVERLHRAVRYAQRSGYPESYDHAVRLLIEEVIEKATSGSKPEYAADSDVWLP